LPTGLTTRYVRLPAESKDPEKTESQEKAETEEVKPTSEERDVSTEDKAEVAGPAENEEKEIEEKKPEVTSDSTDDACEKTANE